MDGSLLLIALLLTLIVFEILRTISYRTMLVESLKDRRADQVAFRADLQAVHSQGMSVMRRCYEDALAAYGAYDDEEDDDDDDHAPVLN